MQEPAEFLEAILAARVLTPEIERNLSAWAKAMNADTMTIAKHIHEQGWLTKYQMQRIHQGKGRKLLVGPYILLEILGEGSMGRVYKARHARLGREVAVKVIRKERLNNPRVVARFQQEVRAAGQLLHPNIVLAIDADTVGAQHYVAMELLDGSDLKSLVQQHGPMPMVVACEYVRQAALGLQHAHEQNLVHRDVKPSNLMVTKQGVIKVLDLGLAMLHDPQGEEAEARMTLAGTVLGTPDYLAPEQARDPAHVDTRADIYALGGTLFYLLTGTIPYDAPTPTAKVLRHTNDPLPSLRALRPDLPLQLELLVHWLMAKLPEHRAQTPLQVAAALQPFCQYQPPPPEPAGSTSGPIFTLPEASSVRRRPAKSNPWPLVMIVLAMAIIAIVMSVIVISKMS